MTTMRGLRIGSKLGGRGSRSWPATGGLIGVAEGGCIVGAGLDVGAWRAAGPPNHKPADQRACCFLRFRPSCTDRLQPQFTIFLIAASALATGANGRFIP